MRFLEHLHGLHAVGRDRWMACCPAHSDHTPSLSIRRAGDRFLLHCFAGCPVEVILEALGLSWADLYDPETSRDLAWEKPTRDSPDARVRLERSFQGMRLEQLWNAAQPLTGEDVASRYLRSRGLLLDQIPASLRYLEALEYHHQGRLIGVFPALIAQVTHPRWGTVALHRTYLKEDGSGKAPVASPRKLTRPLFEGATRGAAIRLGVVGSRLAVAEGLETVLAVQEMTGWSTWASVSAGGMALLEVPETVREVLIAADHDPVNNKTGLRPGEAAAQALASRLFQQGIKVYLAIPPDEGTDWLDGCLARVGILGHSRLWVTPGSGSNQPCLAGHKPYLGHPVTAFRFPSRPAL